MIAYAVKKVFFGSLCAALSADPSLLKRKKKSWTFFAKHFQKAELETFVGNPSPNYDLIQKNKSS